MDIAHTYTTNKESESITNTSLIKTTITNWINTNCKLYIEFKTPFSSYTTISRFDSVMDYGDSIELAYDNTTLMLHTSTLSFDTDDYGENVVITGCTSDKSYYIHINALT